MINQRISKNFTLKEFFVSDSYPLLAKTLWDHGEENDPNFDIYVLNLKRLAEGNLQEIRDRFGTVIIISGLRNEKLNNAVGGYSDSDHLYGAAADFYLPKFNTLTIYQWAFTHCRYRQLICYKRQNFIHLSINHPFHRFIMGEAWVEK